MPCHCMRRGRCSGASLQQPLSWLDGAIGLDFVLVGTKVDKIKSSERGKKQRRAAERLEVKSGSVSWVSSEKGTGIPELRARIAAELTA